MSRPDQSTVRNRLLRAMPADDFALLAPHLVLEHVPKGSVLFCKGAILNALWFPEHGIGSLVAISAAGEQVEIGIVGRDGFAPVPILLGSDRAAYTAHLHVSDTCFSLGADAFRTAVARSPTLQPFLLRYAQTLQTQTAYTVLANALQAVEERVARWLLMCHDRSDDDEIVLTHEVLSVMLAVRRASVTTSLHVLEGKGFLRSERGRVTIRNRAALETFAANSYGVPEREYERLIGPLR